MFELKETDTHESKIKIILIHRFPNEAISPPLQWALEPYIGVVADNIKLTSKD